jgi:hypothetical protein
MQLYALQKIIGHFTLNICMHMLEEQCWKKDGELPDVIALLACSDSNGNGFSNENEDSSSENNPSSESELEMAQPL